MPTNLPDVSTAAQTAGVPPAGYNSADPYPLLPGDRQRLDGIVQQMMTNKEPEQNILAVVGDFKRKYATVPPQTAATPPSLGGFLSNLASSGKDLANNVLHAVTHPLETAGNIAATGAGLGDEYVPGFEALGRATFIPGAAGKLDSEGLIQQDKAAADAFRQHLADRYGSPQQLAQTLYNDPVGALADLSTAFDGIGGIARGAGVAADALNASKTASVLGKVADASKTAADWTNPVNLAAKPVVAAVSAGAKALGVPSGPELAARLYQSALKPGPGSYTLPEVRQMVQTGLENNIPVSEMGAQKLGGLISDLNQKIKDVIASDPTKTVDPAAVAQRVDDAMPKFARQVNPEADVAAMNASKDEFLRQHTTPGTAPAPTGLVDAQGNPILSRGTPAQVNPIPADDAQTLKQNTYKQLGDKAYGQLSNAQIEAQKALARGIKEELATQFPELTSLNGKEGGMLDLQGALERAVRRIDNKDMMGIGTPIAMGAAASVGGGPMAAATGVLKTVMDNPQLKSRLAIAIDYAYRKNPALGPSPGLKAISARVGRYITGIGDADARLRDGEPQ